MENRVAPSGTIPMSELVMSELVKKDVKTLHRPIRHRYQWMRDTNLGHATKNRIASRTQREVRSLCPNTQMRHRFRHV